MIYKLPFTSMTRALYKTLSAKGELEWFDCSVPVMAIEQHFQNRNKFEYGIMGASNITSDANKDSVIWRGTIGLEVYSNYRGRKKIAERLEQLLNYLAKDGFILLQQNLRNDGYRLVSISFGDFSINMPIFGENGIWQSGVTNLTFILEQGDEEQ